MAISNIESLIEETVAYAQSGNRLLAEFHFRKLMQDRHADIEDPAVWFMMAWLAPSPHAMSQALEKLLEIDPANELAESGLRWARGIANLVADPVETAEAAGSNLADSDRELDVTPCLEPASVSRTHSQAVDTVESVVYAVQEAFGSTAADLQASVSEFGFVPLEDAFTEEQYAQLFAEQAELEAQAHFSAVENSLSHQVDPFAERKNSTSSFDFLPASAASSAVHPQAGPIEMRPEESRNSAPADSQSPVPSPSFDSLDSTVRDETRTGSVVLSVIDAAAEIEIPVAAQSEPVQSAQATAVESGSTLATPADDILSTTEFDSAFAAEEARFATVTAIEESYSEAIDSNSLGFEDAQSDVLGELPTNVSVTDSLSTIEGIRVEETPAGGPVTPQGDKPNDMSGARRPAGPSILVVDDSPTVRKLLTMMLSQGGYEVSSAVDGLDAVQAIASHVPQLIITDINMPRLDGYKLCKLVTRNARTRHIPVVMISAGIIDRLRGKLAGCSGYLAKPITPGSLNAVVEFALQESSVR